MQQRTRLGQVGLASGIGEQPIVPDPVEAAGQDVQQKAAHEFVHPERHRLVHVALGAVVLPAERDATFVHGYQPAVRDRDAMRVAR